MYTKNISRSTKSKKNDIIQLIEIYFHKLLSTQFYKK
jgi:hypothetical protein